MSNTKVYENDNYEVSFTPIIHNGVKVGDLEYDQWYEVINKQTGVVEAKTVCMPEAMYLASAYNKSLLEEQWKPADERPDKPDLKIVKQLN